MNEHLKKVFPNQTKINHHFVPQVYIKRFYDEKIQKVWRGSLEHKNVRYITSAQTFYVPKLYDLKFFRQEFFDIEDYYGKHENQISEIYTLLSEIKSFKTLEADRQLLASLFFTIKIAILTQYFRTKDIVPEMFTEMCSNLVSVYKSKEEYFKKEFPFIKIGELEMVEKTIKRGIKKKKKYVNDSIKGLQHSILPILFSDFTSNKIRIIRSETKKYISSDKPVSCQNLQDLLKFENFIYPLTPNILIYALGENVTEDMIKDENKVNDFIFKNAISHIISHDKTKIEHYLK